MQADGGLVQDVEHAHQPRADLAGQPDALGLAAGERGGGAVECQVVQADVGEEPEPAADLLEQLLGDRPRDRIERGARLSSGSAALARLDPTTRHSPLLARLLARHPQRLKEPRPGRSAWPPARRASCRRRARPWHAG